MTSSAYPAQAEAAVPIDPEADEAAAKICKHIHQAVEEGNVGAVRHFLRVDPESLERKDEDWGGTPLHRAAKHGHVEVVALLLRSGASAEVEDKDGDTALHWAARNGHAAVVEQLISAGAKVDAADEDGWTPLHKAAGEGHAAVVEQLISAGAKVDAADEDGVTPLHFAAWNGHAAVVEQLMSAGAKVDAADEDGETALHWAAENGHDAVVEQLISAGAKVDAANINGMTALHKAAENGHDAVVEQLISAGATVDVANNDGETALHFAAKDGHAAVVEQLISAGATVDAADEDGRTELHWAAKEGHAAVVEQLISAGAKVDAADNKGQTPYDWAKKRGHRQVMGLLRPAAAAVAIDLEADEAAAKICKDIHQAVREGNVGAVRHFLHVDPESLERKGGYLGQTPLQLALEHGHVEVVALLLRSGASVEAKDNDGQTALHGAAKYGHAAVVEQLISAGATVDAASNAHRGVGRVFGSRTPLHWAAQSGHAAVVELLISAGATVDAASNNGRTALHEAALQGHAAVVEQLISAGATVDAADNDGRGPGNGQTPYVLAERNGHFQVMGLLRPVFVALLSGRSCRCNSSQERTVLELKEEAEKKLGVKVKHLIGQNQEPLDESMELAAAQIVPGNTLTAVISEDALEEGHPEAQAPSQPADPSMPEDGVEIKDFPHGIRLMAQHSIFEGFDPQIEVLENWSDLKEVSALEEALPAGHMPLARLLRLTPEDRTFPAPVKVQVPTCAGAETLWRSSTTGWEQVETATFEETRATVTVDHFCEFVVTGKPHPLKGLGFLHAQGENAQVIIMHTGCESCERNLELLCSDPDSLQPLRRCSPNLQLGTFRHDEDLEIKQPGRTSKMKIRFHRMPLMSPELDAQSRQHFDVEIEDQNHCFKIRPEETTAATAATAATASRSVGPHAAGSAQASAASTDMRSAVASQQGHLLLSGRFNSNEIIEYMKTVKKQLEARNVPVFMVEATVGQSFADLTRVGLCLAKGMVTFCTSEYGTYTGVGYETFHELEFAHDHRLPLFPIRLCEQWPPAPQNNERGIYQNKLVLKNGLVYIDDRQMNKAQHVADQIAESVARMGIFRTKLQL